MIQGNTIYGIAELHTEITSLKNKIKTPKKNINKDDCQCNISTNERMF